MNFFSLRKWSYNIYTHYSIYFFFFYRTSYKFGLHSESLTTAADSHRHATHRNSLWGFYELNTFFLKKFWNKLQPITTFVSCVKKLQSRILSMAEKPIFIPIVCCHSDVAHIFTVISSNNSFIIITSLRFM